LDFDPPVRVRARFVPGARQSMCGIGKLDNYAELVKPYTATAVAFEGSAGSPRPKSEERYSAEGEDDCSTPRFRHWLVQYEGREQDCDDNV
jgi:hypothetical protein